MLKKFSKFLLLILLVFVISLSSLTCLAHNENENTNNVTSGENAEATNTTDDTSLEDKIHNGDLYLFDNNIVMDKYVNGNVFLFGNNIEITGQVNGNLFVFGNNIKFNGCIIRYSIFACANSVYYNGYCGTSSDYGHLYVAARNFESTWDSYVTGDIKAVAGDVILKSAVYRDVDLSASNIYMGEGENIPVIFGDLRYTSNSEITIPEGVIANNGTVTYTHSYYIIDILIGFITCVLTAFVIYIILKKVTPCFIEKISNTEFSAITILKAFGIGLAVVFAFLVLFILLLVTVVGTKLAFIIALLFCILYLIAVPTLSISITNALKPALKIEKSSMFYLVLGLVNVILYGITLIPFVGALLALIINIISIGLIVNMYLPHKELTEEEQNAIAEAKRIAKENKEKVKQEKLEAKAAKKQEKSQAKEAKKDKEN